MGSITREYLDQIVPVIRREINSETPCKTHSVYIQKSHTQWDNLCTNTTLVDTFKSPLYTHMQTSQDIGAASSLTQVCGS